MKQQPQTNQALQSLDGMSRAPMPDALRQKILQRLSAAPARRSIFLSSGGRWLIAAGIALLAGINVYAITLRQRGEELHVAAVAPGPIEQEYFAPAPSI